MVKRVAVAVLAVACCSEPERPQGTVFTDSAGVHVAIARSPQWQEGAGWRVNEPPLLEIGRESGPPEHLLSEVRGAVRLGDGRIVVADGGSKELRFFDRDGVFQKSVGREGDGPGEFRSLDYVGRSADSIVAYDEYLARVQLYDQDGEFLRSLRVESPWPMAVPTRATGMADERTLAIRFVDYGDEVPNGIVRWPQERLVTLDLDSGEQRSLRTVLGYEASVESRPGGGYRHGRYLFAKGNEFAAAAGVVAVVVTDTFRVDLMDLEGNTTRVLHRPGVTPPPTSSDDLVDHVETLVRMVFPDEAGADPSDVVSLRRARMNTPMASTRPILRSLQMDVDGNIWIEPFFALGEEPAPYLVFRSDGTWLGEVTLPVGLARGDHPLSAPFLEIGEDYVLGVWRDGLDVEFVRLYRLDKAID